MASNKLYNKDDQQYLGSLLSGSTWRPSPGPYDAPPPLDGDGGATSSSGRQQQQQQQQEQQQQQLHCHPWERQQQQPRELRHLISWLLALSIFFT